jgi:tetratricopeptide (TPR) repeat protein
MSTEVVESKSKSRRWMVWTVLAVVIAFLGYKNTDVFKPAANQAYDILKAAVSGAAPEAIVAAAAPPAATLDNARAAFSNGDFQASLQAYKEYIALDSGNIDARGELGNVYYVSGNYQEAAQTYYDLSKILIGQKQLDQVPALLPVIGQVNPSLADELMQQISQIQQQSFDAQAARQS